MKEPLILTIDFGTQSVRAAIFNKKGEILGLEKVPYDEPYFSKQNGWAEQHPQYYIDCLCKATKALTNSHKELLKDIKGITLTCFRDSAVLLDKDLKVIRPCILWLDQRRAKADYKELPLLSRIIFNLVGMKDTIDLNRKRTMSLWLQENEPESWGKVYKYVPISTYFNYFLTGELKDSSSNCTGHYPLDFKKREWYKSDKHLKGQIFGIPRAILPEIVPEGTPIGAISKESSKLTGIPEGITLYASGSDKSCDTLGLGALSNKVAAISYGTASSIDVTNKKYMDSEPFLPSYPSCLPGFYNMEVQVYRGYWMLNWFAKEFAVEQFNNIEESLILHELNKKIMDIEPGSEGLVLQPYWGPGLRRPLAKGAIVGFSDVHTKEHLYRAIIEGIAYALREGLIGFEHKLHHKIKELRVSGGGSRSNSVCQITADIFGVPVARVQTYETSSLGAAISGFLAIKEYNSPQEAIDNMVKIKERFYPSPTAHKKYDYLFKHVYLNMYPRLSVVNRQIRRFERKFK